MVVLEGRPGVGVGRTTRCRNMLTCLWCICNLVFFHFVDLFEMWEVFCQCRCAFSHCLFPSCAHLACPPGVAGAPASGTHMLLCSDCSGAFHSARRTMVRCSERGGAFSNGLSCTSNREFDVHARFNFPVIFRMVACSLFVGARCQFFMLRGVGHLFPSCV